MTAAAHPRIAISLVSALSWPLDRALDLVRACGVGAISLTGRQLDPDPDAAIAAIRASGLPVVSIGTGGGTLIESGEVTLAALRPTIDAAVALDCPTVFTVSGPTPLRMPTDTAFGLLAGTIGGAVAYARSQGIRLCIEHNGVATRQNGFVHTLADAIELSQATDLGIVVELQNCWYQRHLARLFREHVDRLALVQYSDFVVGEEIRLNRRVPGDGAIPLEWMIGALLEAGYAGYFDLEMLGPAIEAEGYDSAIRRGVDWLSERLVAWGV